MRGAVAEVWAFGLPGPRRGAEEGGDTCSGTKQPRLEGGHSPLKGPLSCWSYIHTYAVLQIKTDCTAEKQPFPNIPKICSQQK